MSVKKFFLNTARWLIPLFNIGITVWGVVFSVVAVLCDRYSEVDKLQNSVFPYKVYPYRQFFGDNILPIISTGLLIPVIYGVLLLIRWRLEADGENAPCIKGLMKNCHKALEATYSAKFKMSLYRWKKLQGLVTFLTQPSNGEYIAIPIDQDEEIPDRVVSQSFAQARECWVKNREHMRGEVNNRVFNTSYKNSKNFKVTPHEKTCLNVPIIYSEDDGQPWGIIQITVPSSLTPDVGEAVIKFLNGKGGLVHSIEELLRGQRESDHFLCFARK